MPIEDPTPDTPMSLEDYRYHARRRIALGSFYFMIAATALMLVYGMFWPGGPVTLNAMTHLIFTLYGSFVTIVMAYLGVDAFELHSNNNKTIETTSTGS